MMKQLLFVGLMVVYVAGSCLGLYLMKAAPDWRTGTFVMGVGLYGTGAFLWLVILRNFPLSFAFPIAAGSLIIATILTGRVFLKEAVTASQLIGAALIISGIFLTAARK